MFLSTIEPAHLKSQKQYGRAAKRPAHPLQIKFVFTFSLPKLKSAYAPTRSILSCALRTSVMRT